VTQRKWKYKFPMTADQADEIFRENPTPANAVLLAFSDHYADCTVPREDSTTACAYTIFLAKALQILLNQAAAQEAFDRFARGESDNPKAPEVDLGAAIAANVKPI
jgi:hypothetical protein